MHGAGPSTVSSNLELGDVIYESSRFLVLLRMMLCVVIGWQNSYQIQSPHVVRTSGPTGDVKI